jgi:hypothetical protein
LEPGYCLLGITLDQRFCTPIVVIKRQARRVTHLLTVFVSDDKLGKEVDHIGLAAMQSSRGDNMLITNHGSR